VTSSPIRSRAGACRVGTLVAAALNLLDVAITNDQFLFRRLQPLRRGERPQDLAGRS
jgi:hypothetical protein